LRWPLPRLPLASKALQALTARNTAPDETAAKSPMGPMGMMQERREEPSKMSPSATLHYRLADELANLQEDLEAMQEDLQQRQDEERKLLKREAQLKREVKELELSKKLQALDGLEGDESGEELEEHAREGPSDDALIAVLLEVVQNYEDKLFSGQRSKYTDSMRLVERMLQEKASKGKSKKQLTGRHWQLVRPAPL